MLNIVYPQIMDLTMGLQSFPQIASMAAGFHRLINQVWNEYTATLSFCNNILLLSQSPNHYSTFAQRT